MEREINKELAELMAEEKTATEIAPGMTVEEMKAVYFDAKALREPPYKCYQLNSEGHRYYYRYVDGEPVFYPSVTTMLRQVTPTSPWLIDWMLANGKEGAVEKRDLAAAYGTFMHWQFEELIINRRYDFDKVPEVLAGYIERENLPDKVFNEWAVKIRKDVLAFAQFVRDYKVVPLAIEIALVNPVHNYAGCIDLPCVMTNPKTGEQFTAIVDFKSGRKGFYEDHELQLHLYRMMWAENFPDMPIEKLYNFSPKDWRTKPTYNLKDQTDSINAAKIPALLALAAIEDEKRDNTITVIEGAFDLDAGDIMDNVTTLSLSELIKAKAAQDKEPDEPVKAENEPVDGKTGAKTGKSTNEAENGWNREKTDEFFDGLNEMVGNLFKPLGNGDK